MFSTTHTQIYIYILYWDNFRNICSKWNNDIDTTRSRAHTTGWGGVMEEKSWKYRLAIYYAAASDSGRYTCHTPNGLHNSIDILVKGLLSHNIYNQSKLIHTHIQIQSN